MSILNADTLRNVFAAAAAQLRAEGHTEAATVAETVLLPNAAQIAQDAARIAATGQA